MVKLIVKGKFFTHYERFFDNIAFNDIASQLEGKCYDNECIESKRTSCLFSVVPDLNADAESNLFEYSTLRTFSWSSCGIVEAIKILLESKLQTHFDYCLAHYYPAGAGISWHNDKEALYTDVVSVSFGATRKFRFRKIGQTKGWIKEFRLKSGDIFHMLQGCQSELEHCVPVEKRVKEPRINLTFRKA